VSYRGWFFCRRCGTEQNVVGVRNETTGWKLKLFRRCGSCEFRWQKWLIERARVKEYGARKVVRLKRRA
jgi:hypothetical protein